MNCSGLDVLKEEWKLTVELPPVSIHAVTASSSHMKLYKHTYSSSVIIYMKLYCLLLFCYFYLQNSQQYTVVFNLKPSSIYDVAGQTYCAVNTCNVKNCKNMGESCNITIPVKDGLFPEIEDGNTLNMNNKTDNNSIDSCESKSVIWTPQGTQRGLLSVQLVNSRQVATHNGLLYWKAYI